MTCPTMAAGNAMKLGNSTGTPIPQLIQNCLEFTPANVLQLNPLSRLNDYLAKLKRNHSERSVK
jgi:hypothetical protein